MTTRLTWMRGGVALVALISGLAAAHAGSLKIESWRNDDADIWNNTIIPAFNKHYPDIKVEFSPSAPADYNAALNARLDGGTAGDLIACRPFDASLQLYQKHQLDGLNDLKGMDNFPEVAKAAWSTDDGKTTFCVPMASVIHGFFYNEDAFKKIGAQPPKTMAEFHEILDKLKKDGTYTPIDLGTADQWEAATMGFQNIGPDYWKGEEGRLALIAGKEKYSDPQYVAVWKELASWAPYMGSGFQAQKYPDSQNLFSLGKAAIYPAGSWDISTFRSQANFPIGAFPPPLPAGDTQCFISDHTDIGMGVNSASKNKGDARKFLEWVASPEFAELYANALPGFFPLSKAQVTIKDPLAAEMVGWRKICKSTIRDSYQILNRGTPNLENELWNVSAQVINGTLAPEAAGKQVQADLDKWYKPAAK
ncbi:MAG: carbohydrate ABC transporter substrate-binding protein [Hyphomicrobiales bacterium]|nr:carbohydrate ABC transporter substrate-binding protein [Hyphomicrobiales bacterium]